MVIEEDLRNALLEQHRQLAAARKDERERVCVELQRWLQFTRPLAIGLSVAEALELVDKKVAALRRETP